MTNTTVQAQLSARAADSLDKMRNLQEGWDGHDALPPRPEVIDLAGQKLLLFKQQIETISLIWEDPRIAASADGNMMFEWWQDTRKITIHIEETGLIYIKVWGPSMSAEMEDGELTDAMFLDLWTWLHATEKPVST